MITFESRFGGPEHKDWDGPPYNNIARALHAAGRALAQMRDPEFKREEKPWIDLFEKIDGSISKYDGEFGCTIKSFSKNKNRVTIWVHFPDNLPDGKYTSYVEQTYRQVFSLAADRFERANMDFSRTAANDFLDRAFASIPEWRS